MRNEKKSKRKRNKKQKKRNKKERKLKIKQKTRLRRTKGKEKKKTAQKKGHSIQQTNNMFVCASPSGPDTPEDLGAEGLYQMSDLRKRRN